MLSMEMKGNPNLHIDFDTLSRKDFLENPFPDDIPKNHYRQVEKEKDTYLFLFSNLYSYTLALNHLEHLKKEK